MTATLTNLNKKMTQLQRKLKKKLNPKEKAKIQEDMGFLVLAM